MITEVVKYTNNWELHPDEIFNCLDIDFYNSVMCKKRKIR